MLNRSARCGVIARAYLSGRPVSSDSPEGECVFGLLMKEARRYGLWRGQEAFPAEWRGRAFLKLFCSLTNKERLDAARVIMNANDAEDFKTAWKLFAEVSGFTWAEIEAECEACEAHRGSDCDASVDAARALKLAA